MISISGKLEIETFDTIPAKRMMQDQMKASSICPESSLAKLRNRDCTFSKLITNQALKVAIRIGEAMMIKFPAFSG